MTSSDDLATVSAADISRNFGEWQSRAMVKPVVITHHGRARLILQSMEEFQARIAAGPHGVASAGDMGASAQLSGVLGQMQEGFIAFDVDLVITEANRVAELFSGFAKKDMLGKDLRDVLPATTDSIVWGYLHVVLQTGRPHEQAFRSLVHPGSTINIRAFPHGSGVAVIFNVTAEGGHAEKDQQWWRALQAAVCTDPTRALVRLNLRGGIALADDNFSVMTGFAKAELSTLLLTEIVHPHERLALATAINGALRASSATPMIYRFMNKDGSQRRLLLSMGATSDGPIPDGLLVCVTDIDNHSDVASASLAASSIQRLRED